MSGVGGEGQNRPSGVAAAAKIGLVVGGLAALLIAASQFFPQAAVEEKSHKNWKYVQMATDQTLASREVKIVVVGSDGNPRVETSMGIGDQQRDSGTTSSVVQAIQQGSSRDAANAILTAQKIPEVSKPITNPTTGEPIVPKVAAPTISDGMKEELIRGDLNFFHLFLYDCCAEDGDVVNILVDGQFFATVPLTHAGATLSIPMSAGRVTAIAVEGVRDGNGGITVAFRSSQGDAFMGTLGVGDVAPLGVVGK